MNDRLRSEGAGDEEARNPLAAGPCGAVDPPNDPAAIIRHYTLSPDNLALIVDGGVTPIGSVLRCISPTSAFRVACSALTKLRRGDFLSFIAGQLSIEPGIFNEYARREETRWEHLGEIRSHLRVRPFGRGDYRSVAKIATTELARIAATSSLPR